MKKLLEKFENENPRRKVLDLTERNEKYAGDYVSFNLDILREILPRTILEYEISSDEVRINGNKTLAQKLLFDCQTFCVFDERENKVILRPYVPVTDIMSFACKLLKNFEKNA